MNKFSKKTVLTILITFLVTLLLCASVLVVIILKYNAPFSKFMKVMNIIESSYVADIDRDKCEEAAINAVLASIGDKYAVYYDEENAEETMQMVDGFYVGIGVEVFANTEKGRIEIISAYEDSPADKAGIKGGDLIKSIDGKEYSAEELADAVLYIKGVGKKSAKKKNIDMVILRDDTEIKLQVRREKIELYEVKSEIIDGICYVRYAGFTQSSLESFKKIIDSLDEKSVKGIVLDIRNNPGGELQSALGMCDVFLEKETLLSIKDKSGSETVYEGTKGSCKLPLAVLVNRSSASASEVLAGALQDHKRAVIVGEKTYGKGVTQTIQYIDPTDKSEGALKLTTYKNYTPNGNWINDSITPDIEVKSEEITENIKDDAVFKAAVEYLTKEN